MRGTFVHLRPPCATGESEVHLSKTLMAKLGLSKGDMLEVRYGAATTTAMVCTLDTPAQDKVYYNYEVQPSDVLATSLHMVTGLVYSIKIPDQRVLEIGPVIGLLLERKKEDLRPHQFQRVMSSYPEVHGLVFAFSLDSIDWENKVVHGKYYKTQGNHTTWQPGTFPLPAAIHRRISLTPQTLAKLVSAIPGDIFNHGYTSDKWRVHKHLLKSPKLAVNLPETLLVKTTGEILTLLNMYGSVYLKPCWGEKGIGVIRVDHKQGAFNIKYAKESGTVTKVLKTEEELTAFFKAASIFKRPYLCQQTIPLATLNGNTFDFRVMIMKDGMGRSFCPALFARVAKNESVTTHIIRGAVPMDPKQVFQEALGLSYTEAKQKEEEFIAWSLAVAKHLDIEFGPLGDIGLDLGIDNDGKFWYIECNAHPDHFIFRNYDASMFDTMSKTRLRFASYLAGFPIDKIDS